MGGETKRHPRRWGWAGASAFVGMIALWISYPQAAQSSQTGQLPEMSAQDNEWMALAQACQTDEMWAEGDTYFWAERETTFLQSTGNVSPELKAALERGETDALFRMGVLTLSFGSKPNLDAGFALLLDAAIAGHPDAMYEVGMAYSHGTLNQLQDLGKARSWLSRAAAHRAEASYALYWMVRNHGGSLDDIAMARSALLKAASQCYVHASMNLYLHQQRGEMFQRNHAAAESLKQVVEAFLMTHQDVDIQTEEQTV